MKESQNPLVSMIVRTKDRPKLLRNALRSIAAQDYRPIEVILVNDGGCDLDVREFKNILGDVILNYVRLKKNMGRAHAGNVGIESAAGDYIGFLDDDDEFYPSHLVTLISFLKKSDYKVAYTDSLMVYKEYDPDTYGLNNKVKKEVVFSQEFNYDRLVFENYIPFMCLLFEKKPLVTSGGFEISLELYEDWDLLVRIGKEYPFYHIKKVTANYNQWSADLQISQTNRNHHFLRQAYLKVLSRHIKEITPERVHGIVSDYAHARQTLKDIQSETESHKDLLRARDVRIEGLNNELAERESRISDLNNELSERDAQIGGLNNELAERETRIKGLNNELAERESRISGLNNELSERDARIGGLNNELTERDGRINGLTNELSERDGRINGLTNELSERDGRIDTLAEEMREKEGQFNTLSVELREKDSQVNVLDGELRERDSRMEVLNAEVKEKDAQINNLNTELSGRVSRINTLLVELKEWDSRLSNLTSIMDEKEAEIVALQVAVQNRDALVAAMCHTRGWRLLEKYRRIRDGIFNPLFGISHQKGTGRSEK